VYSSTITTKFCKCLIQFNILDAMKHPIAGHSFSHIAMLTDIMNDDLVEFLGDLNFLTLLMLK